jgi:multidrug efflux pump
MTSFSTILGIMPLVIANGAGAASRQAIGITIVAGFGIGTLFTLFVLPVFYTYFAEDRHLLADDHDVGLARILHEGNEAQV